MELDNEMGVSLATTHGPVRGYVVRTEQKTYYRFKSIPYAKPPIGNLRFLPPVPIPHWTEEIDCTKDAPDPVSISCQDQIVGSEDCLYIEVHSPQIHPSKTLPVMFWIGGYSFNWYGDNAYDPTLLVDEGVVFVRCGYRLGPLGFLSLNDVRAPGNVGLKDLVLAMKWVQQNIDAFGGDPSNVTIFGCSSGATIVHLMMLSPMATGLFHKAIIQSGTALNNWCIESNTQQITLKLALQLGIKETDSIKILEKLKVTPAYDMFKALYDMYSRNMRTENNFGKWIGAIFKPCIEVEFEGQSAFITRGPLSILKYGKFNKVPLIIGSVNDEGSVFEMYKEDFYDYEKCNQDIGMVVPKSLSYAKDPTSVEGIGHQILDFYLGCEEYFTKDTKTQFSQLISDYYFLYFVNKTVRMHNEIAPECPVYYYIVNCVGSWDLSEDMGMKWCNHLGHCVDLPFIFRLRKLDDTTRYVKGSKDSVRTRSRVVKMWTNFAKYGNPTPADEDRLLQITWDPVFNQDRLNFLSIGHDLTKGCNPFLERMTFWDSLFENNTLLRSCVYLNDIGAFF